MISDCQRDRDGGDAQDDRQEPRSVLAQKEERNPKQLKQCRVHEPENRDSVIVGLCISNFRRFHSGKKPSRLFGALGQDSDHQDQEENSAPYDECNDHGRSFLLLHHSGKETRGYRRRTPVAPI